jgi:hypothetical protein
LKTPSDPAIVFGVSNQLRGTLLIAKPYLSPALVFYGLLSMSSLTQVVWGARDPAAERLARFNRGL